MALERKQGVSNLELTCRELLEEEQAKEQRRVQKRQKKKKKKTTKTNENKCEEVGCDELVCSHADNENCEVKEIPNTSVFYFTIVLSRCKCRNCISFSTTAHQGRGMITFWGNTFYFWA